MGVSFKDFLGRRRKLRIEKEVLILLLNAIKRLSLITGLTGQTRCRLKRL